MSLLPDDEVRETTVPLFFDMMQLEFRDLERETERSGHSDRFENELVDKLDVLVEGECARASRGRWSGGGRA